MYPAATRTDRQAKQDVTVCGVKVPKDVYVSMQIYALHHDPQLWPDPEKFDPERFSAEGKAKQHPFQYVPFGHGPRMCIGMRLAQLEVKVAMAHLVRSFRFVTCSETEVVFLFLLHVMQIFVLVVLNSASCILLLIEFIVVFIGAN